MYKYFIYAFNDVLPYYLMSMTNHVFSNSLNDRANPSFQQISFEMEILYSPCPTYIYIYEV